MQGSIKLPDSSSDPEVRQTAVYLLLAILILTGLVIFTLGADSDLVIYAFGGAIALALTAVIFFRPQYGAYILVITIATNVSTIFTRNGLPSINKPVVAIVAIAILARYLWTRRQAQGALHLGIAEFTLFAWGCVWFLSAVGARDSSAAYLEVTDFFKNFIIFLCIIYALQTPQQWKRALWLLILATAVPAALGVYQVFTGNYAQDFGGLMVNDLQQVVTGVYEARLSGPIREPNFYGQILAFVLVLTVYRMLDEKSWWLKLAATTAAFCLALATVNTYSRGAFLTMIIMLVLIAIERRVRPSLLISVGLLFALLMLFLPETYRARIDSISLLNPSESVQTRIYEDSSFRGRTSEMLSGLLMFANHPLLGVGIGNYDVNYQDYASQLGLEYRFGNREAHSLYIETLAETGTLGILGLLAAFGSVLVLLRGARHKIAQMPQHAYLQPWFTSVQYAIISYSVSSVILHGDFMRYLWLLFALAVAATHMTDRFAAAAQLPETR
ncbi:MAG: O-antigen ligase family protein [Anaerolineales bacterium]|nr:O-antigen ligase family protein [Anaerolineales bacterium]